MSPVPVSRALRLIAVAALVAGCQTMSDVKPGDGKKEVIQGHTYDQVWGAAHTVAAKRFDIEREDKPAGTIVAKRPVSVWSYGAWVGIYITPPTSGASAYSVEVVSRKRLTSDIGVEDWETRVLGDMKDVLAGRPLTEIP